MEGQITIKRNVADDINALTEEMEKEWCELYKKAEAMSKDTQTLKVAAEAMHKYQLMVDNGVPEILAAILTVTK